MHNQETIELIKSILKEVYPQGKYLRKGRIVKSYAVSDKYYADIEILKNDETPDDNEPQINGVEIPVIWAGKNRGIICPPQDGMLCDIEYYAGDPNYPRISNFRASDKIPTCELDEFVIQQSADTIFKIKADGSYEISGKDIKLTLSGNAEINIDGDAEMNIKGDSKSTVKGKLTAEVTGEASIKSDAKISIDAPQVSFCNAVAATGAIGVGSPCPLTGTHQKGSSKVFIEGN